MHLLIKSRRYRDEEPHIRDVIQDQMWRRGWRVRDLAYRIAENDGIDTNTARALLWHYFRHPTGDIRLGGMWMDKMARALNMSEAKLARIEERWFLHWRAAERWKEKSE